MSGIKMSDCRFYVNEEERTVVCVIPHTRDMVMDFIQENFDFSDFSFYDAINLWNSKKFKSSLRMPTSFSGKAVCAKEDKWDEETGRLIAYSRAKDKCYKSFFKRANMFVRAVDQRLNDMITKFNDFGLRLEDNRIGINQKIDEKLGITLEDEEEE